MTSPEIQEKLDKYSSNIIKWNEAYNLLSASQNKEQLWNRHINDSLQIHEYIPAEAKTIVDLGSGAGFPAIPCAIVSKDKKLPHHFTLIESVGKKTNFLEDTARILGLNNVTVRNERIEKINDIKADVITARAFAKISEILVITEKMRKNDTIFILHKGRNAEEEINEANKSFLFDYQLVNSVTGDGFIFIAKNVKQI